MTDLKKSPNEVFCLLMHAKRKEHCTTTKIRIVLDASAKSSSGFSLNFFDLKSVYFYTPFRASERWYSAGIARERHE